MRMWTRSGTAARRAVLAGSAVVAATLVAPVAPSFAGTAPTTHASPTAHAAKPAKAAAGPAAGPGASGALPAVYPVPRSMTRDGSPIPIPRTVTLVVGAGTDPSALATVRTVLLGAGATRLVTVTDTGAPAPAPGPLTVYVGGPGENARSASALAALGIGGTAGLPAEGYVLGIGKVRGGAAAVLDGVDATGTYYAAQTLRQLVEHTGHGARFAGVAVRDWPSMATRGVVEGFYGSPWSTADRLSQLDFYGANKMNTYVYSPKDDPYLRARWRDPYPPDQLAALTQLVRRATADHVTFTYALSPGLSVCYSSAADEQALVAKFDSLWAIGVRSFAVPLDDISYTTWNCAADQARFGTGGGAAGAAQAYLLNEVDRDFIATHPGAQPLELVPTEYYDSSASPYKSAIAQDLNADVVVEWTGEGVIPATITAAQAETAAQVYGHKILLWDNYPVNDYTDSQLLLGPYVGRDPGLAGTVVGVTANPMIQAEPSKIALFDVADFAWNSPAYDPATAWQAGLAAFAGGDPRTVAALTAFAEVNYQAQDLDLPQAPALSARFAAFWKAYDSGSATAAGALATALTALRDAPATLTAHLDDPAFLSEAQPWLAATTDWGNATLTALDMLTAQRRGDGARAWADRLRLPGLVAAAQSHTYLSEGSAVTVTVGQGVLDTFVRAALNANATWMGTWPQPLAQTSLTAYEDYTPGDMVDGDPSTFFWSDSAPNPGDYVGVDLGTARPVDGVDVRMAKPSSPDDYLHAGRVEYSADGVHWTDAGAFSGTTEVKAAFPAGTSARYLRLVDTGSQINWVVVDEFAVLTPARLTVTGAPAPAAGSSLADAADGDLDTAYTAASAPAAGDALQVALPATTALSAVVVAQSGATPATGTVQVLCDGRWVGVGRLRGGYTRLAAGGLRADAVRLLWAAGSTAPTIEEIVPVPAS